MSASTLDPADRDVLVAVHRWARAAGWTWMECWGWINAADLADATLNVEWDTAGRSITVRRPRSEGVFVPTKLPAATVREAVGRLVALDVLPASVVPR